MPSKGFFYFLGQHSPIQSVDILGEFIWGSVVLIILLHSFGAHYFRLFYRAEGTERIFMFTAPLARAVSLSHQFLRFQTSDRILPAHGRTAFGFPQVGIESFPGHLARWWHWLRYPERNRDYHFFVSIKSHGRPPVRVYLVMWGHVVFS